MSICTVVHCPPSTSGERRVRSGAPLAVALGDAQCLVPDRADLLLMTIEHAWRWNPADSGVRWVADAVVLLRDPKPFDWDRLVAMSERYWLQALIDDSLSYLASAYGLRTRTRLGDGSMVPHAGRSSRPGPGPSRPRSTPGERIALWLGDAVRSSLEPGSRLSPATLRAPRQVHAGAESGFRASGGRLSSCRPPGGAQSVRRRWQRLGGVPSCGPLPSGSPSHSP
jgi:hypothetical protein